MPRTSIKELLGRFNDADAFDEIVARPDEAWPGLRRSLASLRTNDRIMGLWYSRLWAAISQDPVNEVLSRLPRMSDWRTYCFVWILRRAVAPDHATKFRRLLVRMVGYPKIPEPRRWQVEGIGSRAAVLCEALGMAGGPPDLPLLQFVLDQSAVELAKLRQPRRESEGSPGKKRQSRGDRDEADSLGLKMFGRDIGSAGAAAAAALLAISEKHGLDNEARRVDWRRQCVMLAQDGGCDYGSVLLAPPMPFLFIGGPVEASRLLVQLDREALDHHAFLRDLAFWLDEARDQGVSPKLSSAVPEYQEWLKRLTGKTKKADNNPRSSLRILTALAPDSAVSIALRVLRDSRLDADDLEEAAVSLKKLRPFAEIAAIMVENAFRQRHFSSEGFVAIEMKEVGILLAKTGLKPLVDWTWPAPQGCFDGQDSPAQLHGTLCAIANTCSQARRLSTSEKAAVILEPLARLPEHTLLRHALYRNLFLGMAKATKKVRPAFVVCLEPLRKERDAAMIRAVIRLTKEILGPKGGEIYSRLLEAPPVRKDLDLAAGVIESLTNAPTADAGERIRAFGQKIGWSEQKGDFGVWTAISEAMGRLGVPESVASLAAKVGHSGLGSGSEINVLRLATSHPGIVDDILFAKALKIVIRDEFAEPDSLIMGDQTRRHIVGILKSKPPDELLHRTCEFLTRMARMNLAPPEALPLLLSQLPMAIGAAKADPGEEWEDRNWGGYNATATEELAEALSEAVQELAKCRYSKAGWRIILEGLLANEGVDLTRMITGSGGVSSYSYPTKNLFTSLKKGLARLGDLAVNEALAAENPQEALRRVQRVLSSPQSR